MSVEYAPQELSREEYQSVHSEIVDALLADPRLQQEFEQRSVERNVALHTLAEYVARAPSREVTVEMVAKEEASRIMSRILELRGQGVSVRDAVEQTRNATKGAEAIAHQERARHSITRITQAMQKHRMVEAATIFEQVAREKDPVFQEIFQQELEEFLSRGIDIRARRMPITHWQHTVDQETFERLAYFPFFVRHWSGWNGEVLRGEGKESDAHKNLPLKPLWDFVFREQLALDRLAGPVKEHVVPALSHLLSEYVMTGRGDHFATLLFYYDKLFSGYTNNVERLEPDAATQDQFKGGLLRCSVELKGSGHFYELGLALETARTMGAITDKDCEEIMSALGIFSSVDSSPPSMA